MSNLIDVGPNVGKIFKLKIGAGPEMICTGDNKAGLLGLLWWDEPSRDYKWANIVLVALVEVAAQ